MNAYLLQGLALGFSGGLAPGPLLALVLSATLRGGFRHGLLVSIAPLLTDLPIVLLTVTVVSQLPHSALRVLSLAGAAVLVQHGVATIRDSRSTRFSQLSANAAGSMNSGRTLRQGIVVNFLNPNPWMFWISVGAPLTRSAWMDGPQFVAAFRWLRQRPRASARSNWPMPSSFPVGPIARSICRSTGRLTRVRCAGRWPRPRVVPDELPAGN